MCNPPLIDALSRELVQAGLPIAEARRYLEELRDHHDDLVLEALAAGLPEPQARAQAAERLGRAADLAAAAALQFRQSTRVGRHPFLCFVVAPFLAIPFTLLFIIIMIALTGPWLLSRTPPISDFARSSTPFAAPCINILLPCAFVLLFYTAARRRALPIRWRLISIALLALSAGVFSVFVSADPLEPRGAVGLGLVLTRSTPLAIAIPLLFTFLWSRRLDRRDRALLSSLLAG